MDYIKKELTLLAEKGIALQNKLDSKALSDTERKKFRVEIFVINHRVKEILLDIEQDPQRLMLTEK
jgi:hypothetical protein